MPYLLGVDTGGTFTDAALLDMDEQVVAKAKALTTPHDLSIGVGGAIDAALAALQEGLAGTAVKANIHKFDVYDSYFNVTRTSGSDGIALYQQGAAHELVTGIDGNGLEGLILVVVDVGKVLANTSFDAPSQHSENLQFRGGLFFPFAHERAVDARQRARQGKQVDHRVGETA